MRVLPAGLTLRLLRPETEVEALTRLLHDAYRGLAEMGLRYLATHQTPAVTLDRIAEGECYVVAEGDLLVGTVTFHDASHTGGAEWYDRDDVASLHQLGVHPDWRGRGLGRLLAAEAERRASQTGATEIALDTAEPASHLIEMYLRWGYRVVGRTRWGGVNYASVILSKRAQDGLAGGHQG